MKNVYDSIQEFYNAIDEYEPIISQTVAEGFLRRQAWRGDSELELKRKWNLLGWFINYLVYVDMDELTELDSDDYIDAFLWMEENNDSFILNESNFKACLAALQSFFDYLVEKKKVSVDFFPTEEIKSAFYVDGEYHLPEPSNEETMVFQDGVSEEELALPEIREELNMILEKLLNRIGNYFKQEEFAYDFNRAISLYAGPFNAIPEENGEEFWLGFWDYFLFDYHLNESDKAPLAYFYQDKQAVLSNDECHILSDLTSARFTVFYIDKIINSSAIECVNLFTEEHFELPMPEVGINSYKHAILYGHIYQNSLLMLNYITSIPMSPRFRWRVRDEINRQKDIFCIQHPEGDMNDYLTRHSIMVRHTIDIFVNLAKLNITSAEYKRPQKRIDSEAVRITEQAQQLMNKINKWYRFSAYAKGLFIKLYKDYLYSCKQVGETVDECSLAALLLIVFGEINGIQSIKPADVLRRMKLTKADYMAVQKNAYDKLELRLYDPRYLTEEGFILSLYEF